MKAELKKHVICPDCGKPYKEHLGVELYPEIQDKFKSAIEINRELPKEEFKKWLIERRRSLTTKIFNRHVITDSKEVGFHVNIIELIELNYWYDFVDMIDDEIQKLSGTKKAESVKGEVNNLKDACNGEKEYNTILKWFISNNLCDPETYYWIDRKKTYRGVLVSYIRQLHIKGYTKELSANEVKAIAQNDFGADIGKDWINKVTSNPFVTVPAIPLFEK